MRATALAAGAGVAAAILYPLWGSQKPLLWLFTRLPVPHALAAAVQPVLLPTTTVAIWLAVAVSLVAAARGARWCPVEASAAAICVGTFSAAVAGWTCVLALRGYQDATMTWVSSGTWSLATHALGLLWAYVSGRGQLHSSLWIHAGGTGPFPTPNFGWDATIWFTKTTVPITVLAYTWRQVVRLRRGPLPYRILARRGADPGHT